MSVQNQKINFIYRNFPFHDIKNLSNIMVLKFEIPSHLKPESKRFVNSKLIKKSHSKATAKCVISYTWAQNKPYLQNCPLASVFKKFSVYFLIAISGWLLDWKTGNIVHFAVSCWDCFVCHFWCYDIFYSVNKLLLSFCHFAISCQHCSTLFV